MVVYTCNPSTWEVEAGESVIFSYVVGSRPAWATSDCLNFLKLTPTTPVAIRTPTTQTLVSNISQQEKQKAKPEFPGEATNPNTVAGNL